MTPLQRLRMLMAMQYYGIPIPKQDEDTTETVLQRITKGIEVDYTPIPLDEFDF